MKKEKKTSFRFSFSTLNSTTADAGCGKLCGLCLCVCFWVIVAAGIDSRFRSSNSSESQAGNLEVEGNLRGWAEKREQWVCRVEAGSVGEYSSNKSQPGMDHRYEGSSFTGVTSQPKNTQCGYKQIQGPIWGLFGLAFFFFKHLHNLHLCLDSTE